MIRIPPDDPASQCLHEGGPTGRGQEGGAGGQGEQEGHGEDHHLGEEGGRFKISGELVLDHYHHNCMIKSFDHQIVFYLQDHLSPCPHHRCVGPHPDH